MKEKLTNIFLRRVAAFFILASL